MIMMLTWVVMNHDTDYHIDTQSHGHTPNHSDSGSTVSGTSSGRGTAADDQHHQLDTDNDNNLDPDPARDDWIALEIAYAAELSRLGMITVVTNQAFVVPDFDVDGKQLKVQPYLIVI